MRRRLLAGLLAGALCGAPVAVAAQASAPLPFRILDEERLLRESRLGIEVLAEIRAAEQALEAENQRLSDELAAEERELTEARAELAPEEFRDRADAFDRRVEEIRAERARLGLELSRRSDSQAQSVFEAALPVLLQMMEDQGLVAILKPEALILGADWIDMTDDAIRALNATTHPQQP